MTWLRGRLGSAVPAEELAEAVAVAPYGAGVARHPRVAVRAVPADRLRRGGRVADRRGADELREKTRQLFTEGPRPSPRPSP
ncbi:hypothetical protein [Nonomuraea dietziae]|uniref:hypothetical protein n=1 Tax=Nonomuraea dietziae TaxID=65515 RepID=UPI0031D5658C